MQEIKDTLKDIKELQSAMSTDLALIKLDLQHHIKRTELAEQRMDRLDDKIKPVARHVERIQGAGALLGILALIATILMVLPLFSR